MGALYPDVNDWTTIDLKDIVQPIGIGVIVTIDHRHLRLKALVFLILFVQPGKGPAQMRRNHRLTDPRRAWVLARKVLVQRCHG